jgi:hypothetical protein
MRATPAHQCANRRDCVSATELEVTTETELQESCASCREPLTGKFCSQCGEKTIQPEDYSLIRFALEAVQAVSSVESNAVRSVKLLVTRPGMLTAEYIAGRRRPYLRPLQLFLLCNVIFFLTQIVAPTSVLVSPLYMHVNGLPHKKMARRMVVERIKERKTDYKSYRIKFDATIENQAKTLIICMVPLLAIALYVSRWRPRRYFVEHLVFATHAYAYLLLLLAAQASSTHLLFWFNTRTHAHIDFIFTDSFQSLLVAIVLGGYFYLSIRRTYGLTRRATLVKTLLLIGSASFNLYFYRFILFIATYYSV